MSEIVTSPLNKNTLLYGNASPVKNDGPACVDRKGEIAYIHQSVPAETPIKVIRESSVMKVFKVENGRVSIEGRADVLVSHLLLAYLQGIRDAKGMDVVLIGNNGAEVQMKKARFHITQNINQ